MQTQLICLVAALGVVLSAPSINYKRVCIPVQWEASVFGKSAQVVKGEGQVTEVFGMLSTDYIRPMTSIRASVYTNGKFVINSTVLATENCVYVVDTAKKTCKKIPQPVEIKRICSDSKFLRYLTSWTIGGMQTDTYEVKVKGREATVTLIRDNFIPVTEIAEQNIAGVAQMASLQYGNFTNGIQDPSVFDIPSYCNKNY